MGGCQASRTDDVYKNKQLCFEIRAEHLDRYVRFQLCSVVIGVYACGGCTYLSNNHILYLCVCVMYWLLSFLSCVVLWVGVYACGGNRLSTSSPSVYSNSPSWQIDDCYSMVLQEELLAVRRQWGRPREMVHPSQCFPFSLFFASAMSNCASSLIFLICSWLIYLFLCACSYLCVYIYMCVGGHVLCFVCMCFFLNRRLKAVYTVNFRRVKVSIHYFFCFFLFFCFLFFSFFVLRCFLGK